MSDSELRELMEELRGRLVSRLLGLGFDVPSVDRSDVSRALEACLRILHRTVPRRPRSVHWSNDLRAKHLPEATLNGILAVEMEIRNGDDLNHRLTRRYFDSGFDDRLLNDLGVTHFHLGRPGEGSDRTGRRTMSGGSAALLWAVVEPDDAYFIDVSGHSGFDELDFVDVICRNWKHLLSEPLHGWSDLEPKLSPNERARLRRVGISTLVDYDGEIFLAGQFTKSGLSWEVGRAADAILNEIVRLYRALSARTELVLDKIAELTGSRPSRIRFRAGEVSELIAGKVTLADEGSGVRFCQVGDQVQCHRSGAPVPAE